MCSSDLWHQVDVDPKYGSGWTGYTWNKKLFPDPKRFLGKLHDRGMKKQKRESVRQKLEKVKEELSNHRQLKKEKKREQEPIR